MSIDLNQPYNDTFYQGGIDISKHIDSDHHSAINDIELNQSIKIFKNKQMIVKDGLIMGGELINKGELILI